MLISQILDDAETIRVVARNGGKTRTINGARSVYSLAMEAARTGTGLEALIERKGYGETVDLEAAYKKGRLVSPINHPDPAHLHLTGTGLTHLGSAATRDAERPGLQPVIRLAARHHDVGGFFIQATRLTSVKLFPLLVWSCHDSTVAALPPKNSR